MNTHHQPRWCQRHPLFVRFYVPVIVTLTLLVQLWEMTQR